MRKVGMKMRSMRRIKASQLNGARSRGPKTPAGKNRSSLNAIRHGLLARCTVLEGEPPENFEIFLGQHLEKFGPVVIDYVDQKLGLTKPKID